MEKYTKEEKELAKYLEMQLDKNGEIDFDMMIDIIARETKYKDKKKLAEIMLKLREDGDILIRKEDN